MRRFHRRIDTPLLITLIGVCVFGSLMLLSASSPLGYQKFHDSWYFFRHQLLFGILPGIILFLLLSRIPYQIWKPFAGACLFLSILLLLLVYVPGLGLKFGGADRWVELGVLRFQPSEFVKVTFLLYLAAWLDARRTQVKSVSEGLFPFVIAVSLVALFLILQPNTGSMAVIVGSAALMYLIAGAPLAWFALIGVGGAALIALLIKLTPYRAARFMTFLHPELDPKGIGYHINQASLAIGSGGLFGVGYGHSRQKYLYLPEVAGDSIFAIIAEEMGFFVTAAFVLTLGYLVHRCFVIARAAPDAFGTYLAAGIGCWIAVQSVANISSMLGLLPMTGVTLPFVSYGSSAFIALSIGMGLVASISRSSRAG